MEESIMSSIKDIPARKTRFSGIFSTTLTFSDIINPPHRYEKTTERKSPSDITGWAFSHPNCSRIG